MAARIRIVVSVRKKSDEFVVSASAMHATRELGLALPESQMKKYLRIGIYGKD